MTAVNEASPQELQPQDLQDQTLPRKERMMLR